MWQKGLVGIATCGWQHSEISPRAPPPGTFPLNMDGTCEYDRRQAPLTWLLYEFAQATITKYRRLGGLNNWKVIFSQFWRLEVRDLGVGSVGSFEGHSPWLVDGYLLSVFTWSSLCVSQPLFISTPATLD